MFASAINALDIWLVTLLSLSSNFLSSRLSLLFPYEVCLLWHYLQGSFAFLSAFVYDFPFLLRKVCTELLSQAQNRFRVKLPKQQPKLHPVILMILCTKYWEVWKTTWMKAVGPGNELLEIRFLRTMKD